MLITFTVLLPVLFKQKLIYLIFYMCLSHSDPDSSLNLFFNSLITTAQIFSKGNNTFILHLRLQTTNKVS